MRDYLCGGTSEIYTYVYWFSVIAGSVIRPAREKKKEDDRDYIGPGVS